MNSSNLLSTLLLVALVAPLAAADYFVYVGTYTRGTSKGIYVYRLDSASGKLTPLGLAAETVNPSFLAIHPGGKFLYAVSEAGGAGMVNAFAIDAKTGMLKFLNKAASKGSGPCHATVDKTGRCLLVANYGSWSVAALEIKADGTLAESASFVQHTGSSVDPKRQQGPHAHSVNVSRDNRFAVVADLGLDKLLVYKLDAARAAITPNQPPFAQVKPGSGPRHFAFHPNGKLAFVINEMASTVTAFRYDAAEGAFKEVDTAGTLPAGFSGTNSTAEVQVHPGGKFLYGSNRGHDSIAVFAIDAGAGKLKLVQHESTQGKVPRNFGIDPAGSWLIAANQSSDSIVVFRIDKKTGRLTPSGQKLDVGAPVCVKFLAVGR